MLSSLLKGPVQVVLVVKNMPAKAGDLRHAGSIPRSGRSPPPQEEGMATLSNILAWRIPWTEEPGELLSMGSQGSVPLRDCACMD